MKLINQSYKIIPQEPTLEGIYNQIETAGRLCYKSERPEGKTAKEFVDKLINMKHYSVLEHGTVYLKISNKVAINHDIFNNPYTKWVIKDGIIYLTTNYRVLLENDWMYLLKHLCEPTEYHEKRITVHFITSIGIVRELLRHRKFSFSNESTRYVGYYKKKFGNEITYIIPYWYKDVDCNLSACDKFSTYFPEFDYSFCEEPSKEDMFYHSMLTAEKAYLEAVKLGATPQEAREVLPLATKSELIMTGFESDWKDLCDKRSSIASTGKPHPCMVKLIDPLMKEIWN